MAMHARALNVNYRKKSFTLIEILITLVIIGVVIAVFAIPKMELAIVNARGGEAMLNLRQIADAAWMYYVENGCFGSGNDFGINSTELESRMKYFIPREFVNPVIPGNTTVVYDMILKDRVDEFFGNGGMRDILPRGSIVSYAVMFSDHQIESHGIGEKIDNTWYRYYFTYIKDDNIPALAVSRDGWPGNR